MDGAGSIYVANNRNGAATITKLTADASTIIYSTSIAAAVSSSLAVDQAGSAYVTGTAMPGLPTTAGADQSVLDCVAEEPTCRGGFVVKLSPTGVMQYGTYYWSPVTAIAVNSHGEAWITGAARHPYGTSAFVAMFNNRGQRLFARGFGGGLRVFSHNTYGGGLAIAVDAKDAAYAVGYGSYDVPTTAGTIQPGKAGYYTAAAYIVKFNDTGNIVYGTYLDGTSAGAVTVDDEGRAYVATGGSPASTFAATCGLQLGQKLLVLNADATTLLSSRDIPGGVLAMSHDGKGAVYVAGNTRSTAFLSTPGAYLKHYPFGSMGSGFAAKFDFTQPAKPAMSCVVNAANFWAGRNRYDFDGSVAPGEVVTLFGRGFEPGANLKLKFDGEPAPILYADTGQINAVVPFKTGRSTPFTLMSIHNGAEVLGPYELPVSAAAPGIFATYMRPADLGMAPNAMAAAVNEDGSVNSSTNPATPGSVISIFATGAGAFNQQIEDGSPGPLEPPFPAPVLGVGARILAPSVYVPGTAAEVLFAGQAPGLIAGIVQVNVRIPADTPDGTVGVAVSFGDYSSTYPFVFVGTKHSGRSLTEPPRT
jgi:uncharacterized protein (TIGR03437 family)